MIRRSKMIMDSSSTREKKKKKKIIMATTRTTTKQNKNKRKKRIDQNRACETLSTTLKCLKGTRIQTSTRWRMFRGNLSYDRRRYEHAEKARIGIGISFFRHRKSDTHYSFEVSCKVGPGCGCATYRIGPIE